MTLTNRLGRPMLAAMFISGGVDQLRDPRPKAAGAKVVADQLDGQLDHNPLPDDPETLVRINGAIQVTAGALLAMNKLPRLSSLALAGSLVPTTYAAHRFWEEDDPEVRDRQKVHFFKNVAMLGGLLIAAGDTGGRPSIPWRARRALHRSSSDAPSAAEIAATASHAVESGRDTAAHAVEAGRETAAHVAGSLADVARHAFEIAAPVVAHTAEQSRLVAHHAAETGSEAGRRMAAMASR